MYIHYKYYKNTSDTTTQNDQYLVIKRLTHFNIFHIHFRTTTLNLTLKKASYLIHVPFFMQFSNSHDNILKTTINRFVYIANDNLLLYSDVIIIIIMGFGKSVRFVKGGIGM